MASTKAYLDFVLEQLSGLDEISSRAMMGAFILYYRVILSILVYTLFSRMFDLMQPPVVKHSIAVA